MSSTQQVVKKKIGLNTVISWGASVVIVGLMFKILHWQGGEYMIAVGLMTEAFLFFILGIASMSVQEEEKEEKTNKGEGLDALLNTAISPKVIDGLTKGFDQFTKTVASVNQIAGSANTNQNFLKEVESATVDVKKFRDGMSSVSSGFENFTKTMQSMSQISASSQTMVKDIEAASQGMRSYAKNVSDMNASFDQFNKTLQAINQMTASSQAMVKEFETATQGMRAYNKNLTDLSKVYQAQLEAFRKN